MLKTKMKQTLLVALLLSATLLLVFLFSYLRPDKHVLSLTDRVYLRSRGEIVIAGDESFPPFSFSKDKDISMGYEVDLINLLRTELAADIRFIQLPWSTALHKLASGEIDAVSGMRITPEREEKYHFTVSYLTSSHALIVPITTKDIANEKFDPLAFIRQNALAVQRSSATIETVAKLEGKRIVSTISPCEALSLLQGGHVPGWVENHQVALYFLRSLGLENDYLVIPLAETYGEYAIAFAPENKRLAAIFDHGLRHLIDEEQLLFLDKTWFGMVFPRPQMKPSPLFTWLSWGVLALLLAGLFMLTWNFLLRREVSQATSELQKERSILLAQLKGTVLSFGSAIKEKDNYTGGHCQRVAHYAVETGREIGLTQEELFRLELAALLHDVGKIGIPDHILKKTGLYTDEEYEVMKKHPQRGAAVLMPLTPFSLAAESALFHHERWDGNRDCRFPGYPGQKSGADIPLFARIISIADAFDAMTSKRSYKKNITVKEAIVELRKNKGTQFDPQLVDVFCGVVQRDERWKKKQYPTATITM